jgi:glycosyltransferase involved in cell wall biosynthesis
LRIPVIETYHTYFEEYLHHYVPLMPRAVMRFVARRFTVSQCNVLDSLVVPSRAMEQALLDYGVQCPMHIIPTGMEMDRFASGDGQRFRAQLGIAPGQPVLVHVGRIAHEKNIEFLFRMFEIVVRSKPGAVFVVAGEGPALTSCKAYVRTLGLAQQVRFVGYLSRERELLDCYRAGDLFVFSSKTETQGLVLLESLALGVPVVSTAHMGTADIVNPQRGAHVAPDDEAEFANTVVRLLDDAPRRAAMSAEARAYAATWSATAMADRLAGLYSAVLGQVSRNSPVSQPV